MLTQGITYKDKRGLISCRGQIDSKRNTLPLGWKTKESYVGWGGGGGGVLDIFLQFKLNYGGETGQKESGVKGNYPFSSMQ